jgi:hypothetical protein
VQLAICWDIRVSRATSTVPSRRYRDNVSGADNQQERSSLAEDILRDCTPAASQVEAKIQSELHGDVERPAEMSGPLESRGSSPSAAQTSRASNRSERNSLSGKFSYLPRRLARGGREPAHIGETLTANVAAGDPEGSPRDPLTTDPKGEACRNPDCSGNLGGMQYAGPHW